MEPMKIVYKPRLENRTENGGFGPTKCSKCNAKVTCYLEIYVNDSLFMILCKGCLYDGIEIINNAMLENIKNI